MQRAIFVKRAARRGRCGLKAPRFRVAGSITPAVKRLPARADGHPRVVARLARAHGVTTDFVRTSSSFRAAAPSREARGAWHGKVLESTSVGKVGDAVTLIRVNASGAPTVGLAADLIAIDPRARGAFKVSSRAGLGLIALAADAAAHGLRVAPNLLTEGAGVLDRATGITATDQVKVEAINDRPMAEITKPAYNAHVYSGQPFKLEGRAHDPNQPGGLPCDALTWSVPSGPAAGGCSPTMTLYGDN